MLALLRFPFTAYLPTALALGIVLAYVIFYVIRFVSKFVKDPVLNTIHASAACLAIFFAFRLINSAVTAIADLIPSMLSHSGTSMYAAYCTLCAPLHALVTTVIDTFSSSTSRTLITQPLFLTIAFGFGLIGKEIFRALSNIKIFGDSDRMGAQQATANVQPNSPVVNVSVLSDLKSIIESSLRSYSPLPSTNPNPLDATSLAAIFRPLVEEAFRPVIEQITNLINTLNRVPSANPVTVTPSQVLQCIAERTADETTAIALPASGNHAVATPELRPTNQSQLAPLTSGPMRMEVHPSFRGTSPAPQVTTPMDLNHSATHNLRALEEVSFTKIAVIPSMVANKKSKTKRPKPTPAASSPKASELLQQLSPQDEAHVLDELRKREANRRQQEQEPTTLTEEEKTMTLGQLYRKWKLETQQRRQQKETLRFHDFEDLGQLTEEHKTMTRQDLKRLINKEKNRLWADAQRAKGFPVLECETCHHLHSGDHQCMLTKWKTDTPRGSVVNRQLVVRKTGQTLQLKATPIVDEAKVAEELSRLQAIQKDIETRRSIVTSVIPTEDTPMIQNLN